MPRLVGLDLGACGIRAVEAVQRRDGYVITRAAQMDLPDGWILNGVVLEPESVARALRRLWRTGHFTTRRVAVAITDTAVITRQLELPWMPPDDFRAALRYQVADSLPVDLAAVELDYQPLAEYQVADQHGQTMDMLEFLLVAANTEQLRAVADVILRARLEPVAQDTSAFALIRSATGGVLTGDSELRAIVDIGADALTVVVHQGGRPRFIRAMPNQGGALAIRTLSEALDMTTSQATDQMWKTGLNGPPPIATPVAESSVFGVLSSTQDVSIDPLAKRTLAVINPWATSLVGAIRDSLDYFAATGRKEPVQRLDLAGRASTLPGLAERIGTELRIPVAHVDPFASVKRAHRVRRASSAALGVATGLAMGA